MKSNQLCATFSKNLLAARLAANLTRFELSEKVGCSRGTIAVAEQGARVPRGVTVIKIAEVLGVAPEYFFVPVPDSTAAEVQKSLWKKVTDKFAGIFETLSGKDKSDVPF